ncbi:GNAT family N-acetyltransferase [Kitasatospora sp. NPDC054939]
MAYRYERIRPGDWERLRAVRLEQLQDTPMAFMETYSTALAHGDEEWRFRAIRVNEPGCVGLVAVDGATGEWVGTMLAMTPEPGTAVLMGVWVHPDHRGRARGVTDGLLDAVTAWARGDGGADRMVLRVHEQNERAQAFYRRRGFAFTGGSEPYRLDPSALELEMAAPLR